MASELVHRTCPVCSGADHRPHLEKDGLKLVACSGCGMIFTTPVPAAMASGEYYDQSAASYYLSPEKLESDYATVRFQRELRLFEQFCAGGRVLDVGCSSGGFLFQLSARNPGKYQTL